MEALDSLYDFLNMKLGYCWDGYCLSYLMGKYTDFKGFFSPVDGSNIFFPSVSPALTTIFQSHLCPGFPFVMTGAPNNSALQINAINNNERYCTTYVYGDSLGISVWERVWSTFWKGVGGEVGFFRYVMFALQIKPSILVPI